jgi:SAM-dependent methyltransferase
MTHDNEIAAQNSEQLDNELYAGLATRFDKAAKLYDAAYGPATDSGSGSAYMDWLHTQHLATLREVFPEGASLLDIGCGTGEEALALVQEGFSVLGIDVSPAMVRQAQTKAAVYGIKRGVSFRTLAAGQLSQLDERGPFQGAYSSLGALNTELNLPTVAEQLHDLLEPDAAFVATVMSRRCLYETLRNLLRGKPGQTRKRPTNWEESRAGAGGVRAPVRHYAPDDFAAIFAPHFTPEATYAFPLWLPPLHMQDTYNTQPEDFGWLKTWDRRMRGWPGFRAWGDHFTMVLRHEA